MSKALWKPGGKGGGGHYLRVADECEIVGDVIRPRVVTLVRVGDTVQADCHYAVEISAQDLVDGHIDPPVVTPMFDYDREMAELGRSNFWSGVIVGAASTALVALVAAILVWGWAAW